MQLIQEARDHFVDRFQDDEMIRIMEDHATSIAEWDEKMSKFSNAKPKKLEREPSSSQVIDILSEEDNEREFLKLGKQLGVEPENQVLHTRARIKTRPQNNARQTVAQYLQSYIHTCAYRFP